MDYIKKCLKIPYFWSIVFPTFLNLTESTTSLVIGIVYSDQDKSGISTFFLKVSGAILLSIALIKLLAYVLPCISNEKITNKLSQFLDMAYWIVIVWGCVKVFGAYQTWNSKDPNSPYYCPVFPFGWAFSTLIIWCILIPLLTLLTIFLSIKKEPEPPQYETFEES